MKFSIAVFFIIITAVSCKSKKSPAKVDEPKLRAEHKQLQEFRRLGFEPFYDKVPDSMKKWIKVFSNVLGDDQEYRIMGVNPSKEEISKQTLLDSQNLIIVTNILDKYGWPARYDAGTMAQLTISMVIQHAPLKIQEKYYPGLIEGFKKDSAWRGALALLEDRINVRHKRAQYYGTQAMILEGKPVLYPLVSVDSVLFFRNRLGLSTPFDLYLKSLKIDWDPGKYKRQLPALKKKLSVSDTLGLHYSFETTGSPAG